MGMWVEAGEVRLLHSPDVAVAPDFRASEDALLQENKYYYIPNLLHDRIESHQLIILVEQQVLEFAPS